MWGSEQQVRQRRAVCQANRFLARYLPPMRPPVYLDHAATTPVRPEVLEAMMPYLTDQSFGNPSSAHRFGRAARAGIEQARRQIAEAVGAEPSQVIFTSGGTEADNLSIVGAALAARDRGAPMCAAVSAIEHKAVPPRRPRAFAPGGWPRCSRPGRAGSCTGRGTGGGFGDVGEQ